jgi:hypothetical protein
MVNRQGHPQRYEELEGAAEVLTVAGMTMVVGDLTHSRKMSGDDLTPSKESIGRSQVT